MNGRWILLLLALGMSQGAWAQDDRLRHLFNRSTPLAKTAYPGDRSHGRGRGHPRRSGFANGVWIQVPRNGVIPVKPPFLWGHPGTVNWHIPEDIAALDSAEPVQKDPHSRIPCAAVHGAA